MFSSFPPPPLVSIVTILPFFVIVTFWPGTIEIPALPSYVAGEPLPIVSTFGFGNAVGLFSICALPEVAFQSELT